MGVQENVTLSVKNFPMGWNKPQSNWWVHHLTTC